MKFSTALSSILLLIGLTPATAQSNDQYADLFLGQLLAQTNCAACHQVGMMGESINPDAPPFWKIGDRVVTKNIAEILINKLTPEHTGMPRFNVERAQAELLQDWITWIQIEEQGKKMVVEYCSDCHATVLDDESQNKQAPPFRNLSIFFPIEKLKERFKDGINSGHPDMPVFDVHPHDLNAILAYIQKLQKP